MGVGQRSTPALLNASNACFGSSGDDHKGLFITIGGATFKLTISQDKHLDRSVSSFSLLVTNEGRKEGKKIEEKVLSLPPPDLISRDDQKAGKQAKVEDKEVLYADALTLGVVCCVIVQVEKYS